jgi:hypothetical protein
MALAFDWGMRLRPSALVLFCWLGLGLANTAQAQLSRYSQAHIVPIKQGGKGAEAGEVIGFKLRLLVHSENPQHTKAWVGLVSQREQLLTFAYPGQVAGKSALYSPDSGHWHQYWTVEGLKRGVPSEQEFTIYYRDHPKLVPGGKYQLAATFPIEGAAPQAWKHSYGADWGGGWGEPSIELPK